MSAQVPQISLGSNPPTALSSASASPPISEDQRLIWATTRLRQKLWESEQPHPEAARPQTRRAAARLFRYLRVSTLSALVLASWAAVVGLMITPAFASLQSFLLLAPAAYLLALGLAGLAEDIRAAIQHRTDRPAEAFKTFFRCVARGSYLAGYGMLAFAERNNVVRKTPNVPGLTPSNGLQVTFDSPDGFASYWRDTLQQSRPKGWEDAYSVLSWPMRWLTIQNEQVHRASDRMVIVSGQLVLHYVPFWVLLVCALFLGLPAPVLIPGQYRRARLTVKKALVETRQGWSLLNGELLSAEDIAGAKMSREAASRRG